MEKHPILPITVRQSIIHVGLRVTLLQILFGAMYLFIFSAGQYLFRSPEIAPFIGPLTALALIPALMYQLYETVRILLRWIGHYYIIKSGEIVFVEGIINRKQNMYPLKHIESITCDQSPIEQLFHFGTIKLYNPYLQEYIHLEGINNPHKHIRIIEEAMPELDTEPTTDGLEVPMGFLFGHA